MTKQSSVLLLRVKILNTDDTIAAVSTAAVPVGAAGRSIIRVSGPEAFGVLSHILTTPRPPAKNRICPCVVHVDEGLDVEGWLYCFFQPHSYTGQDLAELHLDACAAVVDRVLQTLYRFVRPAAPGEFTQRAYLNGKMDLTQAEAVAEIVSAANTGQLAAAEQLLKGRFSETISKLREQIIDLLSLLEAGLDFSEEDIAFITKDQALDRVRGFEAAVSGLLDNSIRCERMIDMDSVGLAGLPNAGKSRLLNALLGTRRSIVSGTEATTRDVLTGVLRLEHLDCVLFDCAGLLDKPDTLVNQLSHEASLAALNTAAVVVFCIDAAKDTFADALQMRRRIDAASVLYVLTKTDLIEPDALQQRQSELEAAFGAAFIPTSAAADSGLDALKAQIRDRLLQRRRGDQEHENRLAINRRHEQKLSEAKALLAEAADEINNESAEIAAMLLRQGYELLGLLETENISETILDSIFSRFCIGK